MIYDNARIMRSESAATCRAVKSFSQSTAAPLDSSSNHNIKRGHKLPTESALMYILVANAAYLCMSTLSTRTWTRWLETHSNCSSSETAPRIVAADVRSGVAWSAASSVASGGKLAVAVLALPPVASDAGSSASGA